MQATCTIVPTDNLAAEIFKVITLSEEQDSKKILDFVVCSVSPKCGAEFSVASEL